jgi:hypothetical protein
MAIESWLNENSPTELRGAILSLYGMLTMVATAAGQLFLAEADPAQATLFIVAALRFRFRSGGYRTAWIAAA